VVTSKDVAVSLLEEKELNPLEGSA